MIPLIREYNQKYIYKQLQKERAMKTISNQEHQKSNYCYSSDKEKPTHHNDNNKVQHVTDYMEYEILQ